MKHLIRATLSTHLFPHLEWLILSRHPRIPPGENTPGPEAIQQADELAAQFMSYLPDDLRPYQIMLIESTSPRIKGGSRAFVKNLRMPVTDTPHLLENRIHEGPTEPVPEKITDEDLGKPAEIIQGRQILEDGTDNPTPTLSDNVADRLKGLVHSGIKALIILGHKMHTAKLPGAMFPGCPKLPPTKMAAGYMFDLRTRPATFQLIEHPDAKADHEDM
jgi:hypothetical protein